MLLERIIYKWSDIDIYAMKLVLENYGFLVYMYYMHPGYQTSIFGEIVRITFKFLQYKFYMGTL